MEYNENAANERGFVAFLKRKNVELSGKRYFIDAMGAMANGLFASLLIGTIIATLGQQLGVQALVDIGGNAKGVAGPAMAVAIAYALKAPNLVLFSMVAVGSAAKSTVETAGKAAGGAVKAAAGAVGAAAAGGTTPSGSAAPKTPPPKPPQGGGLPENQGGKQ